MAKIKHPRTGEVKEIEGEIPWHLVYGVEDYDEESDEVTVTKYVPYNGRDWIVLDDGVETVELGPIGPDEEDDG